MKSLYRYLASSLALLPVWATATLAAQTTIVQGGGNALVTALAGARNGDTLLVRPGRYVAPIVDNLAVTVRCDAGVTFRSARWVIRNLAAGRTFVLQGGTSETGFDGVHVERSAGAVIIEEFEQIHPALSTVLLSQHVSFHDCSLSHTVATDSRVCFDGCQITGPVSPFTVDAALGVVRSEASLRGGVVRGEVSMTGGGGAPGVRVEGGRSRVTLAGDASTVVVGGVGMLAASAIIGTAGRLRVDPDVRLLPTNAPAISGAIRVIMGQVPAVKVVADRGSVTANVYAEVGSTSALFLSWLISPIPFISGDLWIDPNSAVVDLGVVGPTGLRRWNSTVPSFALGQPVVLQAISMSIGSNNIVIGTPSRAIID